MADPEVTGAAFLGIIRQVKDRCGPKGLAEIVEQCGPRRDEVFKKTIRVMGWYPYSVYTEFLEAIDRRLGRGDLAFCRTLGEHAGQRDLGTIFRIYVALASPERLIRSCTKVWAAYHRNAGTMSAISWSEEETVLRIEGFPGMHPGHCRLMEGWMAETMATIGCPVLPGAHERTCMSRGGAFHEFWCQWRKRT
jgi:hypothetical protein